MGRARQAAAGGATRISAVVFAYSEVGARCLTTLLEAGVHVPLVFTHADFPGEKRWFASVAEVARAHGIEALTAADPGAEPWLARIAALAPHYILSFYYRQMLGQPLLQLARWGALNMHGSLLPKYRGRAPVNWAIANGETETGATLHYMVEKPDAGPIVAQEAVPIGIDDHALEVSIAVAAAAQRVLLRALPLMQTEPPPARAMDLTAGSYFGGRRPEDGRIEGSWPAARVHAMIRAVAPPFPGAFMDWDGQRLVFAHSHWSGDAAAHPQLAPCLYAGERGLYLDCRDGLRLLIASVLIDGEALGAREFHLRYGEAPLRLAFTAFDR